MLKNKVSKVWRLCLKKDGFSFQRIIHGPSFIDQHRLFDIVSGRQESAVHGIRKIIEYSLFRGDFGSHHRNSLLYIL